MLILTVLLTALLCAGAALLPSRLNGHTLSCRDAAAALGTFAAVWILAFCMYQSPGLRVDFSGFRLLAILSLTLWVAGTAAAFRVCQKRGMAAVLFAAALGCEIFLFNFPYFATHEYKPVDLGAYWDEESTALRDDDGIITLDEEHHTIRFSGIEQPLYNLQINDLQFHHGEPYTDAQDPLFTFWIFATDEGAKVSRQGWSWDVAWQAPRSYTRTLDLAGEVSTLTLDAYAYDGESIWYELDYTIGTLQANVPRAFRFSLLRCLALYGLLLAAWGLRPASAAWREDYLTHRRKYRPAVLVCAGVLCLLTVLTPFADPVGSGVAARHYNVNNWDESSRVSFTYHINDWQHDAHRAQYGSLAHSLLNGRLDLMLDPPDALVEMENPYDTGLRSQQAPDALWDATYYNGRYYVYFGVVPCLLFQLPFELLTGIQDLPNCAGMIVMGLLLIAAVFGMVRQSLIRWFPGASAAAYLLVCVGIVSGSQLYFLLLQSAVYEYAILCGASFVVLALWQWLCAANTPVERRGAVTVHLLLGSLCMALVAGCRPQMELFAFLALPIFWQRYVQQRRLNSRGGRGELAAFVLPVLAVAAALMWYNAARFGSPIDFGANYNLTSNDMTSRGFKLGRIAPALFTYFLQLPVVQAVFPYLQGSKMVTNYAGITITELYYGGILTSLPMLWSLLALPGQKSRAAAKPGLYGVLLWTVAASVILAAVDCEMAGVLYRYLMDFSLPLLFAAGLCWLQAEETLRTHRQDALCCLIKSVRVAMALSVAAGAFYSFCVVFGAEPLLFGRSPALFQNVSHLIQFWL